MLQKLTISLKYWRSLTMKIVLTIILTKNRKTLKQQSRKLNSSLQKRMKVQRFKDKWYNEECKFAIEEMKKAREKWLIKGRMKKEEQEYHHKRKKAHNIIRNKEKRKLAMKKWQKAEIQKEYFDKFLNTKEPRELIKKGKKEISKLEVEELTKEDYR